MSKKNDKPYFFNVQEALIDKGYWRAMKDIDRTLYIALCRYQDWETKISFPSNAELSKVTGMCLASVINAGKNLKALGLVHIWYHKEEGARYHKKFYRIEPLDDLPPLSMDISTRPKRMDISTRKRDKKGKFQRDDSKANGVTPSIANGTTPSIANGHELISVNLSQGTNLKKKSRLSCKDKEKNKETIREFLQLKGEAWTRSYLTKHGYNPDLVNEV
jgi:hypothetical protein